MNPILKCEIKKGVIADIGSKVEETLETAVAKKHEARGAKLVLRDHVKNLIGIVKAADEEVEKSIPDLETLKIVKSWLEKTIYATENLAGRMENLELQCAGEISGYEFTHDMLQRLSKTESATIESIQNSIAEGDASVDESGHLESTGSRRRVTGARPGLSIKQQRQAEDNPKRSKKQEKKTIAAKTVKRSRSKGK